jgi:hypothetical protein
MYQCLEIQYEYLLQQSLWRNLIHFLLQIVYGKNVMWNIRKC